MDKIDGPYYFFSLIKRMRAILPPWLPMVGIEGRRHQSGSRRFCRGRRQPYCPRQGTGRQVLPSNRSESLPRRRRDEPVRKIGHAPDIGMRLNVGLLRMLPAPVMKGLSALPVLKRLRSAVMRDLELPDSIFTFASYPTRFDNREAASLLEPAGIPVPRLENYAWKLWDYWERHLDPALVTRKHAPCATQRQGCAHHGRLLGDRQGGRLQAREGRREGPHRCARP